MLPDILNVSKLVSRLYTCASDFKLTLLLQNMGLLSINPVPFDLAAKVQEVVHMFMV